MIKALTLVVALRTQVEAGGEISPLMEPDGLRKAGVSTSVSNGVRLSPEVADFSDHIKPVRDSDDSDWLESNFSALELGEAPYMDNVISLDLLKDPYTLIDLANGIFFFHDYDLETIKSFKGVDPLTRKRFDISDYVKNTALKGIIDFLAEKCPDSKPPDDAAKEACYQEKWTTRVADYEAAKYKHWAGIIKNRPEFTHYLAQINGLQDDSKVQDKNTTLLDNAFIAYFALVDTEKLAHDERGFVELAKTLDKVFGRDMAIELGEAAALIFAQYLAYKYLAEPEEAAAKAAEAKVEDAKAAEVKADAKADKAEAKAEDAKADVAEVAAEKAEETAEAQAKIDAVKDAAKDVAKAKDKVAEEKAEAKEAVQETKDAKKDVAKA